MDSTGPEIWAQAASPDSTASRLNFTASGLRGTVTQTVTKDRELFISCLHQRVLPSG
jgi:hypothetical protein